MHYGSQIVNESWPQENRGNPGMTMTATKHETRNAEKFHIHLCI